MAAPKSLTPKSRLTALITAPPQKPATVIISDTSSVSITVLPHERFDRHGDDLLHVLRLPMTQAALGAHLRIATLDGEEDLVIPTGTQTGRVFKLRGRGVPSLRGRGRGDLIVSVEVVVPEKLSAEEAQLIRRLAELRGEDVAPREEGFFSRIKSAFQ